MTVEQFRTFRDARPFEPFVVHIADGRFFAIFHPDAAALSRSGRTLSLVNQDGLIEVIDMLLVISLRPMNPMEVRARMAIPR